MSCSSETLLATRDLCKSYGSVQVLHHVSLGIQRGEIVALIGENGAGKSTFLKCLCGIIQPTSGNFSFDGKAYSGMTVAQARKAGIVCIPQEFDLINQLNVYENIFLGCEKRSRLGLLNRNAMRQEAKKLLGDLGSSISPDALIQDLSVAEKQFVEIAKALSHSCKLLIMDEPTTVLNDDEVQILFRIMTRLKENGTSILYVSHKLREIKAICDRVCVLRDGALVSEAPTAELSERAMAERMVGRELSQVFPPKRPQNSKGKVILELENLSSGNVIHHVSMTLREGEILGIAGLPGAGRTELAECLYGIRKVTGGTMRFYDKVRSFTHPRQAIEAGIAYLSEDRQGSGILTGFSVRENTTLVSLKNYCHPLIDKAQEKITADKYISAFQIRTRGSETLLQDLSGGNQQKVAIAKGLDTAPKLFIFDEPTRGIDIKAKSEVYAFLQRLLDDGISCILISSDLEELMGLCNRVGVMREGRLAGILENEQITEKQMMFLATGV